MEILTDQNAHTHPPTGRCRNHHKRHSRTSTQMSIETNGKGRSKNSHQWSRHRKTKTYSQNTENEQNIKKSPKKTQKRNWNQNTYQINVNLLTNHIFRVNWDIEFKTLLKQNLKSESKVTHRNTVLSKTIGDFSINRQINAINKLSVPNHNKRPETQTTTDIQCWMQCQTRTMCVRKQT